MGGEKQEDSHIWEHYGMSTTAAPELEAPLEGEEEEEELLTQMQHMETMAKEPRTPAVPTIQVSRRNRITPRTFCRHGR